jgi:hypothetical protein
MLIGGCIEDEVARPAIKLVSRGESLFMKCCFPLET